MNIKWLVKFTSNCFAKSIWTNKCKDSFSHILLLENNKNICKSFFKLMLCRKCLFSLKNKCSSRVVNPLFISILVYLLCLLQRRTWKYFQDCHSFTQVKYVFHCRPLFALDLGLCSANHLRAKKKYSHDIKAKMYGFKVFCFAYVKFIE